MPFVFPLLEMLNTIYVARGSTDQEREALVQDIIDEKKKGEEDDMWNPVLIYPEGTQGNGTHLTPFKRGAFQSLLAVTPVL